MTPVDDLKPGMFIVIAGDKAPVEPQPVWSEFPMFGSRQHRESFNGRPYEILAISLPFVCVTDGDKRFAVDVREYSVQRVSKQYVREMTADTTPRVRRHKTRRERWREQKKAKAKPDPRCCKRCGTRMVERLVVKPEGNEWAMVCPQCGLTGKSVKAE